MNKWKVAFLGLTGILLFALVALFYLATASVEQKVIQEPLALKGNVLTVQTTAKEFEAIAKQYLGEAVNNSPLPVEIEVDDKIYMDSMLTVFNVDVPIRMAFDPIVSEGNIILKQTSMNVGKLNIPPKTVLKIMDDAVNFPDWITIQPNDEEIYVDLSRVNIAEGSRVRAKEIDLANDKILLELVIPSE